MGTVSLGIDLGSTGLRAAYAEPAGDVRIVAGVGGDWRRVFREPDETGLPAVFLSLKSKLGLVSSVRADEGDADPRDVLSRALAEIRRQVTAESSADIGQTVIAVPVNYGSAQRTTLRECARAAGLSRVRLVSDSMAAAVAHAGNGTSCTFLVFAMGYRGFEAGLIRTVRGQYRTLGHAHAPGYGGAAFDEQLLAWWVGETCPAGAPATWDDRAWENLRADAQALRERWTGDAAARYPLFVPGGRLAGQPPIVVAGRYSEYLKGEVTATVNRAAAVLRDASVTAADVDAVLLAGGCTRMWPVRELVARLGKTVVTTPETHLAAGAARYACILAATPAADGHEPAPDPGKTAPAGRGGRATGREPATPATAPPTGSAAILVQARTCLDSGRYEDAVALAHRAWHQARPDETDIFEGMIDIHCVAAENAGSGDFESAGRWLRCALTHGTGNDRVRRLLTKLSYERATALSDAGQPELAIQVLEDALRVAADHPPSRDLYRRLKRARPPK